MAWLVISENFNGGMLRYLHCIGYTKAVVKARRQTEEREKEIFSLQASVNATSSKEQKSLGAEACNIAGL